MECRIVNLSGRKNSSLSSAWQKKDWFRLFWASNVYISARLNLFSKNGFCMCIRVSDVFFRWENNRKKSLNCVHTFQGSWTSAILWWQEGFSSLDTFRYSLTIFCISLSKSGGTQVFFAATGRMGCKHPNIQDGGYFPAFLTWKSDSPDSILLFFTLKFLLLTLFLCFNLHIQCRKF